MPHTTIARSADLQRLVQAGYALEIRASHLLVKSIPYVNTSREVRYGTLASTLQLAGDITTTPETHAAMFIGDMPCDRDGNPMNYIRLSNKRRELGEGLIIDRDFSSKPMPSGSYPDYYEKVTAYVRIISGPARDIDPSATASAFSVLQAQESESVFRYHDTASTRAGTRALSEKLEAGPVAIVGVGGTGSSHTRPGGQNTCARDPSFPTATHSANTMPFAPPGAVPIAALRGSPEKAVYFRDIYSEMHRNIIAHGHLSESNAGKLAQMDFAFIAVGDGPCP